MAARLAGAVVAAATVAYAVAYSAVVQPGFTGRRDRCGHGRVAAVVRPPGIDRAHARSAGWRFDVPASAALTNVSDLAALAAVPWSLLTAVSGEVVALVVVTAVSILMNASALEGTRPGPWPDPLDPDRPTVP